MICTQYSLWCNKADALVAGENCARQLFGAAAAAKTTKRFHSNNFDSNQCGDDDDEAKDDAVGDDLPLPVHRHIGQAAPTALIKEQ